MNAKTPDWGQESRFYLPNEDAAALCAALHSLERMPLRPLCAGGSGMLLLEAASIMRSLEKAVFADIAAFQCAYFRKLLDALQAAQTPDELRAWFGARVFPELRDYYLGRKQIYTLPKVMHALEKLFHCRFLFEDDAFCAARQAAGKISIVHGDIAACLSDTNENHDFIYLSNIPDYLDESEIAGLFRACRGHEAPVYLLLTSACACPEKTQQAWEQSGFSPHASCAELNILNQGLGSRSLRKAWNRPGFIYLLSPSDQEKNKRRNMV
ncbi:MAG: hypothetical protein LBN33_07395 [Desulfovibrio sp.]|jgi:hypothetical protein|nr:hypothetical protein [Desulfovibrio sp.]